MSKKINLLKTLIFSLLFAIMVLGIIYDYSNLVQERIANEVLRLHVLANSDTYEDQMLKLAVRDRVLEYLSNNIPPVATRAESKELLLKNMDKIAQVAKDEISKQGYEYTVTTSVGNFMFPTKSYEGFSLPAGYYDALQIKLGASQGQNWWCVLYPNICGNSNYDEELERVLCAEDYNMVTKPALKFRLVEFFAKFK